MFRNISLVVYNSSVCVENPYELISGQLYVCKADDSCFIEFSTTDETLVNIFDNAIAYPYCQLQKTKFGPDSKDRLYFRLNIQELKCIKHDNTKEFSKRIMFILADGTIVPQFRLEIEDDALLIINEISKYTNLTLAEKNLFVANNGRSGNKSVTHIIDYALQSAIDKSKFASILQLSMLNNFYPFLNYNYFFPWNDFNNSVGVDHEKFNYACITEKCDSSDSESDCAEFEVIYNVQSFTDINVQRTEQIGRREWSESFDCFGRVMRFEDLKRKIFKGGLCHDIRKNAWKFLLGVYPWTSTIAERMRINMKKNSEYQRLHEKWKSLLDEDIEQNSVLQERKNLIEKDVYRTDRSIPFYSGDGNKNVHTLYEMLMCFNMYNPDLGYVQGMSDIIAVIYFVIQCEVDAFWCFVQLMNKIGDRFMPNHSRVNKLFLQLLAVVQFFDTEFACYLRRKKSAEMLFCFRWLMVLFKREFCYRDTMILWEVLWANVYTQNFDLLICAAILLNERNVIMECNFGFSEILKYMNDLSLTISLDSILKKAEELYLKLKQVSELPELISDIICDNS